MTLVTKKHELSKNRWTPIAQSAGPLDVVLVGTSPAILYVGSSVPPLNSEDVLRIDAKSGDFQTVLTTEKVYARSLYDQANIVTLTAAFAEVILPSLNALTVSNDTFLVDAAAGTPIADITGKTALSNLTISTSRLALNGNLDKVLVGMDAQSLGNFTAVITETLDGASNSPRTTSVVFKAVPKLAALALSKLSVAEDAMFSIDITGATTGSLITSTNLPAGMSIDSASRKIAGTVAEAGDYDFSLVETLDGAVLSPKTTDFRLVVIPSLQAPSDITLTARNGQAVDGYSVETWRGREILAATANMPNCRIEVVSGPFASQGQRGSPHMITTQDLSAGPVGRTRTMRLRATNAAGYVEKDFDLVTKPFVMDPSRYLAFWDYTDTASIEVDPANNRVKKVTDKLNGRIREHSGGYAAVPGTNAPVYDATTKRMTLTRASAQYLKLAPDAVNDPIRNLLGKNAPKLTHLVFVKPAAIGLQQGLFDYRNAGVSRGAFRISTTGPALTWLRASDSTPTLNNQSLFGNAESPLAVAAGVPFYASIVTNGVKVWGLHDNRVTRSTLNDLRNDFTTVTDVELGRTNGTEYFGGEIMAEIIVADDICASELRGIYDTYAAKWGLPARVEPKAFDFSKLEDTPFYDTGFDGIQINPTLDSDYVKPTGWVPQIGDRYDRMGVSAANDTENAYHLDPRWSGNSNANTMELTSDSKRIMRFKPRSQGNLDAAVNAYIASLGSRYKMVGSALSTRRSVAPGPSHGLELLMKNPPALSGNFACFGWTLSEGGGHPPEVDWNEQSGGSNEVSQGLHQAPRWPLMGTRLATGGDGGGMARSHMDRETHSYQFIQDELTDVIEYYMDGYLHATQRPQRGLRLSSVKAFKEDLIAGTGRGSNILADNGTTTGTLKVRLGGGGLATADYGRGAKFSFKIVAGEAVDLYWDLQTDTANAAQAFVPGSYNSAETASPLVLQKAAGSAITFSGGAGTLPTLTKLQVGVNDPIVPEDFHTGMYLIVNNAAGGFTGTVPDDRVSEGYVARVTYKHMKRAAVVVGSGVQTAADTHCTNLFAAIAARGTPVPDADKALLNTAIAKLMATDLMAGKPMDGADPIMDYTNHRTLWNSIGMLGLFFGVTDGLVDIKDPSNVFTVQGAPVRSNNLGYSFDGRVNGNQLIDTIKQLSTISQFGRWAHTLTALVTKNDMEGAAAKVPLMGAGSTVSMRLGGPTLTREQSIATGGVAGTITVPDCFSFFLGTSVAISTDAGRAPIGPGMISAVKREQRVNVWKNGDRKVPYFAGIIAARDYVAGHVPGDIPATSFRIGSEAPGVQGAKASVGGFILSRAWSDEEHAAVKAILQPLASKYAVPGF